MADTRANIFITATDRSRPAFDSLNRNMDSLSTRASSIAAGVGKLAGIATVATVAFSALSNVQAINILDQLDDLAEKTGVAVEQLSGLRYAGEVTGTPLEALSSGLGRLSKQMAQAAGGNKEASATFAALDIKVKNANGSLRTNEEVLLDLADRFSKMEDGAGKAAWAQQVFGKSGADMIPLLNQGAAGITKLREEAQKLGGIYSGDLAKQAAAFNDNLARLKLVSEAAAVAISGPLITALTRMTNELLTGRKVFGGYFAAFTEIGLKTGPFDSWSDGAKKAAADVERLGAEIARLESGQRTASETAGGAALIGPSTKGGNAARLAAAKRELESAAKRKAYFDTLIYDQAAAASAGLEGGSGKGDAPAVPNAGGGAAEKDDPTKKLLENRLKDWERGIAREGELLGQRNKFLDLYNSQGLVSVQRYYDAQQAALDEATANQLKGYDDQLAALRDYQAKATKQTDKAEAQGKIDALAAKRAEVEQEAGAKGIELAIKRAEAEKEAGRTVADITAQFAELNGRMEEAAGIKFDAQFEKTYQLFRNNLNPEMVDMLDRMRAITVAQAQINDLSAKWSVIQGDLQMGEERISMALERGTMGELDSLRRSGELRRQAFARMQEQAAKFAELQARMDLTPEQRQAYERLQLQMDQLGASIDPLADKFNTLGNTAMGTFLGDVATGAKTAKQAFNDLMNSMANQITNMIAQQWGQQLMASMFGGTSAGSFGGLLSGLFGAAVGGMGGGAAAAATSGASSSMYSLSSGASGLGLKYAGAFAEGGKIGAGEWGIVGERGMELVEGPATVTPAHKLGNRTIQQTNNYLVPGRIDRTTQTQLSQRNRRELEKAGRLA